MRHPHGREPRREDRGAQLLVERSDLDHQAAGEPRAHALVQRLELRRRTVGGDDHLAAGIDQRVDGVAELGLDRLALDELHVVEDQQVDAAQALLEGQGVLGLQRVDEAVHEAVGGEVDHPAAGLAGGVADAVQQVGLPQADAGVEVQRIVERALAVVAGDAVGGGMRQGVRTAEKEVREGQAGVERGAVEVAGDLAQRMSGAVDAIGDGVPAACRRASGPLMGLGLAAPGAAGRTGAEVPRTPTSMRPTSSTSALKVFTPGRCSATRSSSSGTGSAR